MKTKYFILAAAAALFAACSSDDGLAPEQQAATQAEQVPVAFDSYVNRATTRAGQTGVEDLSAIKNAGVGFGVFAYYTNAESYDNLSATPNFMYNENVTWSTDKWVYAPVKYWPNEFGNGALSDDVDKVSFFAYAPYVSVTASTGKVASDGDWGIVGMTRNNEAGDPMVKYISNLFTDQQVDLLWGTVPNSQVWNLKNTNAALAPALVEGLPWLNIQHPQATSTTWNDAQKVSFDFKHATAQLNVTVDTKVDNTTTAPPATYTKVFIRSVTFEGFDTKGALNLNNIEASKPLWYNFNCGNELNNGSEVTIQDGRKDGKEGLTAATKENAVINPKFVQSGKWADIASSVPGVKETPENLFRTSAGAAPVATDPIFVIPNGDQLKVTIEYDVLTADDNLAGTLNDGTTKGSVVKNVITRYITIGANAAGSATAVDPGDSDNKGIVLTNGKKYIIKLHLGLNSVQFDAAVTPWTDVTGGADLPHNN